MFSFQGVSPKLEYRSLKRKPRQAAEDEGVIPSERSAEEVAPVRRNFNSGKKKCRGAEYQGWKLTHGNRRKGQRKDRHRSTNCEGKPGRRERKKQRLSRSALNRTWTKGSERHGQTREGTGGDEGAEKRAPVERLWERSREERKETNSKLNKQNRKDCMGNQTG